MIIDEYFIIMYASRKDTSTKFYTYVSSLKNIVQTPVSRDWYEKKTNSFICVWRLNRNLSPIASLFLFRKKKGLESITVFSWVLLVTRILVDFLFQNTYN